MFSAPTIYARAYTQNNTETMSDDLRLFEPLLGADARREMAQNNQRRATSVERVLLDDAVSQRVLRYYMRQVALVIETDLRNRPETALAGSVCNDIAVPIELSCEVERRVVRQCEQEATLVDWEKRDMPEPTPAQRREAAENYRSLRAFQTLAELLSGRVPELVIEDSTAALALFFSTVPVSRTLQALLGARRVDGVAARMPDHTPLAPLAMRNLCRVLQLLTPQYRSHALSTDEYVARLRDWVFLGVVEPPRATPPPLPAAPARRNARPRPNTHLQ